MKYAQQPNPRWWILFLSCLIIIANYYCYDNPAALKSQLQSRFYMLSKDEFEYYFNLLYSIYSVPNIILPFIGGSLIDKYGIQTMMTLFTFAILFGQCLFAFGSSITSMHLMLVGRFFYGLGGENLGVAQSTLIAAWFHSKELAFALGINLSIARLGSVINNFLSPEIASRSDVTSALYFGCIMCLFSLLLVFALIPLTKPMEASYDKLESNKKKKNVETIVKPKKTQLQIMKTFSLSFWLLCASCFVIYGCVLPFNNIASSLIMERDYFRAASAECSRCGEGRYIADQKCNKIADGCPMSPPFSWPLPKLSANCSKHVFVPGDQYNCTRAPPFIKDNQINCDNSAWVNGPFTNNYCKHKIQAAKLSMKPMSIPYIMSAILSPGIGYGVDQIGLRALLTFLASVTLTVVHVIIGTTRTEIWIPLIFQGIAYAVYASAVWPAVARIIPSENLGTSYGIITSLQNAGLALFPIVVAAIHNIYNLYIPNVEYLFISLGGLGSLIGIWLNIADYRQSSSPLNQWHRQRSTPILFDEPFATQKLLYTSNGEHEEVSI